MGLLLQIACATPHKSDRHVSLGHSSQHPPKRAQVPHHPLQRAVSAFHMREMNHQVIASSDDEADDSRHDVNKYNAHKRHLLQRSPSPPEDRPRKNMRRHPRPLEPQAASWERHTRGMGSKIMAKLGYCGGSLGKHNHTGIVEALQARVRPRLAGVGADGAPSPAVRAAACESESASESASEWESGSESGSESELPLASDGQGGAAQAEVEEEEEKEEHARRAKEEEYLKDLERKAGNMLFSQGGTRLTEHIRSLARLKQHAIQQQQRTCMNERAIVESIQASLARQATGMQRAREQLRATCAQLSAARAMLRAVRGGAPWQSLLPIPGAGGSGSDDVDKAVVPLVEAGARRTVSRMVATASDRGALRARDALDARHVRQALVVARQREGREALWRFAARAVLWPVCARVLAGLDEMKSVGLADVLKLVLEEGEEEEEAWKSVVAEVLARSPLLAVDASGTARRLFIIGWMDVLGKRAMRDIVRGARNDLCRRIRRRAASRRRQDQGQQQAEEEEEGEEAAELVRDVRSWKGVDSGKGFLRVVGCIAVDGGMGRDVGRDGEVTSAWLEVVWEAGGKVASRLRRRAMQAMQTGCMGEGGVCHYMMGRECVDWRQASAAYEAFRQRVPAAALSDLRPLLCVMLFVVHAKRLRPHVLSAALPAALPRCLLSNAPASASLPRCKRPAGPPQSK